MTPQSWKIAGLIAVAVAVILAIVAIVQAFFAVGRPVPVESPALDRVRVVGWIGAAALMRALVLAVLAGVAFFTGLACFFWSAMVEGRLQRAEIIERLAALRERE